MAVDVTWLDSGGSSSYGAKSIQAAIDDLARGLYRSEFNAKATDLTFGGRRVRVGGPNRDGGFELSSGRNSIILHADGTLQASENWRDSRVHAADMEQGIILIDMKVPIGTIRWRVDLSFDNEDPKRGYVGRVVSNMSKERVDAGAWFGGSPEAAIGFRGAAAASVTPPREHHVVVIRKPGSKLGLTR